MATELPAPESRVESYLAKAAGEDVTIPEKPLSRLEQYLNAIAEGGGGGGGGTSNFNELSNRPKYNGTAMTGETDIPQAPSVVQTTGSSTTDVMSQNAVSLSLFSSNNDSNKSVRIGNTNTTGAFSVSIGRAATGSRMHNIAIGDNAQITNDTNGYSIVIGDYAYTKANQGVAIGGGMNGGIDRTIVESGYGTALGSMARIEGTNKEYSVALGSYSKPSRAGEVNVGTGGGNHGYNSTDYRLIGGVHDPVDNHDAATKGYVDGLVGNVAAALNAINNGSN